MGGSSDHRNVDSFFARNRLSAYLDGTLSKTEAAEVCEAIARDPELQREYRAMRRALEVLHRQGPLSAPSDLHLRVMGRVTLERGPSTWRARWRRSTARVLVEAIALAAAAVLAVVILVRRTHTDPRPARTERMASPNRVPAAIPSKPTAVPSTEVAGAEGQGATVRGATSGKMPAAPMAHEDPAERATAPAQPASAPTLAPSPAAPADRPSTHRAGQHKAVYVPAWDRPTYDPEHGPDANAAATRAGEPLDASSPPTAPSDGGPTGLATSYGYRITLSDAAVLDELDRIASQFGGELLDASGHAFAPRTLSIEDNYARVHLVVDTASTRAVQTELSRLGATMVSPVGPSPRHDADRVVFQIEVQYMP